MTGTVSVDEVVRAVRIALGAGGLDQCDAIDANGDAQVGVEELVAALAALLSGCA